MKKPAPGGLAARIYSFPDDAINLPIPHKKTKLKQEVTTNMFEAGRKAALHFLENNGPKSEVDFLASSVANLTDRDSANFYAGYFFTMEEAQKNGRLD